MTLLVIAVLVLGSVILLGIMSRLSRARRSVPTYRLLTPLSSSPYRVAGKSRHRGF
jgi:hypothetical protein